METSKNQGMITPYTQWEILHDPMVTPSVAGIKPTHYIQEILSNELRRRSWLKIQTRTSRKWRRIYQGTFRGWLNHYYSTTFTSYWGMCNFLPFGKCVNAWFSNFYRHLCLFQTKQSENKSTEHCYSKAVKSSNSNHKYGDNSVKCNKCK